MRTINDGGPAFPSHGSMGEVVHDGMTLRDYFAAKAMQSYMMHISGIHDAILCRSYAEVANESYDMANHMLAARKAKP